MEVTDRDHLQSILMEVTKQGLFTESMTEITTRGCKFQSLMLAIGLMKALKAAKTSLFGVDRDRMSHVGALKSRLAGRDRTLSRGAGQAEPCASQLPVFLNAI